MRGFGNIGRSAKNEPAAAPAVAGADNGLTVVAGNVELGGANALIHDTTVDLSAFFLLFNDGILDYLLMDPANTAVTLGDITTAAAGIFIDLATDTITAGDVSGTGTNTKIDIKDPSQSVELSGGGVSNFTITGAAGAESAFITINGFQHFLADPSTGNYFFGDIAGIGSQTSLLITDGTGTAQIASGGFSMLFLDMPGGIFQLGASAGGTANTTFLQIDDPNQQFTTASGGATNGLLIDLNNLVFEFGDRAGAGNGLFLAVDNIFNFARFGNLVGAMLVLDGAALLYRMGDCDGASNSTVLGVDDTGQLVQIDAVNGLKIVGDTTMIHTGTAWANGAAAAAGTLNNAPAAGDPTKWIPVDDNGTVRHIPAW